MDKDQLQTIINEFLKRMNVDFDSVDCAPSELPDYIKIVINTKDSRVLIGKDGEHLTALGFVVRKVVEKKSGDSVAPKFFIDIGGYQANKIQKIQKVANIMADRASSFKRDIELPPMTAYERMVIHSTLSLKPNIKTESEGQGPTRRVVVKYMETSL